MSPRLRLAALVALGTVACSSSQPVVGSPSPSQTADVDAPAGETVTGNTAVTLGVPPGHLPRPGHCRIWVPGTPPGHQAKARSCDGILAHAPAGSMVIYRPYKDKKIVRVRYVDRERVGVITIARVFEVGSGRLVREERQ